MSFDRKECPICHRFVPTNWIPRHMAAHEERGEKPRLLPMEFGEHRFFILPCGREVESRDGDCCRTVCAGKTFAEIDECYAQHKEATWKSVARNASKSSR
jgi:hypothetical protein